jgi:hypothetical protein
MPSATIQVSFVDSEIALNVASNDPAGTVEVNETSTTINLLPSSSNQTVFTLTFEPDGSSVTSILGVHPGPLQTSPPPEGPPTLIRVMDEDTVLEGIYPTENLTETAIFSSEVNFVTQQGRERHDPSIAFNPPD